MWDFAPLPHDECIQLILPTSDNVKQKDGPLRPQHRFSLIVICNWPCICGLAQDLHIRLVEKQNWKKEVYSRFRTNIIPSLVMNMFIEKQNNLRRRCLTSRLKLMTYCPKSAKLWRPIQLKRAKRAQLLKKDKERQKRGRLKMNRRRTNSLHSVPSESTTRRMIHGKKIANIRRQLARGKYDINERINIVLDRILEDLIRGKNEQ
jgi:hypothetical protein